MSSNNKKKVCLTKLFDIQTIFTLTDILVSGFSKSLLKSMIVINYFAKKSLNLNSTHFKVQTKW